MQQDQHDPKQPVNPADEQASDPIEEPGEVPESNDEKIDQDFPGYPHYPAEEDILNPDNNTGREPIDVENLSRAHRITSENLQEASLKETTDSLLVDDLDDDEDDIDLSQSTEADVTKEDLLILGALDADQDLGEDEDLPKELEVTGFDLDVPGSELDDDLKDVGEEDEENNYYSLGGDNHENLEEDNRNDY